LLALIRVTFIRRAVMRNARFGSVVAAALVGLLVIRWDASAQAPPNPYRIVEGWAQLPNGKPMGAVGKVAMDPDGRHVLGNRSLRSAEDPARFGDECRDSKSDPVLKFGPDGKVVKSFGAACSSGRTASTSIATATCG
jgi:hypothetical protein